LRDIWLARRQNLVRVPRRRTLSAQTEVIAERRESRQSSAQAANKHRMKKSFAGAVLLAIVIEVLACAAGHRPTLAARVSGGASRMARYLRRLLVLTER
jgi:hypothetical protein